jgi:hypothetical protein
LTTRLWLNDRSFRGIMDIAPVSRLLSLGNPSGGSS